MKGFPKTCDNYNSEGCDQEDHCLDIHMCSMFVNNGVCYNKPCLQKREHIISEQAFEILRESYLKPAPKYAENRNISKKEFFFATTNILAADSFDGKESIEDTGCSCREESARNPQATQRTQGNFYSVVDMKEEKMVRIQSK